MGGKFRNLEFRKFGIYVRDASKAHKTSHSAWRQDKVETWKQSERERVRNFSWTSCFFAREENVFQFAQDRTMIFMLWVLCWKQHGKKFMTISIKFYEISALFSAALIARFSYLRVESLLQFIGSADVEIDIGTKGYQPQNKFCSIETRRARVKFQNNL